ncbi:hypothetical protein CBR_g29934 [Chara braunii]|uniref:Uncharacterized protein n=1 Tax=Chara braunii TaxID=69332 RepID=A0A388JX31_CHABU|nr:hypothetical protein CBR_g29934 [Chara braunii]|eukprot:GBG62327.1 hypothetical protein CBR_g29934 [Chara braunii]
MADARETLITCAMYATMAVILVVKWKMNTDALLRKYALLRAGLLIRGGDSRSDSQNVLTNMQSYLQTYLKSNLQQTAAAVAQFKYMIDNAAATAVGALSLTGGLLDEEHGKGNDTSSSSKRKVPKRGRGDGQTKRMKRRKRNPEVPRQLKIVLDALGSLQPGSGSGSAPGQTQTEEHELEQTTRDGVEMHDPSSGGQGAPGPEADLCSLSDRPQAGQAEGKSAAARAGGGKTLAAGVEHASGAADLPRTHGVTGMKSSGEASASRGKRAPASSAAGSEDSGQV